MPAPARDSADEDAGFDFNNLSRESTSNEAITESAERRPSAEETTQPTEVPKPKRIACVVCRKRKLKCDSQRPSCSTCIRLGHDCQYDEVRKKSGPKRGYVKKLEARLAQLEDQYNRSTQKDSPPSSDGNRPPNGRHNSDGIGGNHPNIAMSTDHAGDPASIFDDFARAARNHAPEEEVFPWEMIGLGLDEPLPTQDVIDELNQIYFEKVHPSLPMLHRPRYYAAMNLAPHMRPPICLRYAMWALAAALVDKYDSLQEHFYQRARKYLQQDEMRGHGESMITVAHAQAWILVSTYEFKMMFFPRAWMSAGRASRLSLMMGLHRLDGLGLDVKQCLPPCKDVTDKEERRRTFWMAFCVDRYSSIGTGWPMVIDERDILTDLPVDEATYEHNRTSIVSMRLEDALKPSGVATLNSFSAIVLMACLFGRNLLHLHRPSPDDLDDNIEKGEFWRRHRELDNILLATVMGLPDHLRLPVGMHDPNVIFVNMSIHTSAICLHQAAIFKADRNRMPARISGESKTRCIAAANEISKIMRMISHTDLAAMNPFISFCLYVASRVMVQYLKSRSEDNQGRSTLQFLFAAMHVIKRKNPLTESFLVQLEVDLEGANLTNIDLLRPPVAPPLPDGSRDMPGCPYEKISSNVNLKHQGFAYGDAGVALYNNPNGEKSKPMIPSQTTLADVYGNVSRQEITASDFHFSTAQTPSTFQFNLPNREKSAGPNLQSRVSNYHSPSNNHGIVEMDTSPDAGNSNQHTPNSSNVNVSSHTSNTAHSSPNDQTMFINSHQQQQQINGITPLNDSRNGTYFDPTSNNDFNMNILPQYPVDIDPNDPTFMFDTTGFTPVAGDMHTGFTPGPDVRTGLTPGPNGINPSDMDYWNVEIGGFEKSMVSGVTEMPAHNDSTWSTMTTLGHSDKLESLVNERARGR